jgi:hypothetical protein
LLRRRLVSAPINTQTQALESHISPKTAAAMPNWPAAAIGLVENESALSERRDIQADDHRAQFADVLVAGSFLNFAILEAGNRRGIAPAHQSAAVQGEPWLQVLRGAMDIRTARS